MVGPNVATYEMKPEPEEFRRLRRAVPDQPRSRSSIAPPPRTHCQEARQQQAGFGLRAVIDVSSSAADEPAGRSSGESDSSGRMSPAFWTKFATLFYKLLKQHRVFSVPTWYGACLGSIAHCRASRERKAP